MPHFAGQVIRFERIELTPSTDASPIPDFRFVGVVVSEPTQPGIVITKTHPNDYQGVLRGGDAHHHTRDGNKYIYATQLPLAYFDDGSINQIQGDKVQRGILDLTGIFEVVRTPGHRAAPRPKRHLQCNPAADFA